MKDSKENKENDEVKIEIPRSQSVPRLTLVSGTIDEHELDDTVIESNMIKVETYINEL